jgi:hypothetical protein
LTYIPNSILFHKPTFLLSSFIDRPLIDRENFFIIGIHLRLGDYQFGVQNTRHGIDAAFCMAKKAIQICKTQSKSCKFFILSDNDVGKRILIENLRKYNDSLYINIIETEGKPIHLEYVGFSNNSDLLKTYGDWYWKSGLHDL